MRRLRAFTRPVILWALALGSATITVASLAYFDPDSLAPFVIEKLPLPHEDLWLAALKVHVMAAALALPGCLLLAGRTLRSRAPRWHRWLGRATGATVLLALAPSGFYLALFAKGGLPGTLGFVLSGGIVAVSMVRSVRTARARDFVAHRRWTLHVLAQLSVAVTSRLMLFLFNAVDADANRAYLVSLWLPVLGSAVLVELVRRNHEAPIHTRHPPSLQSGLGDAARF